MDSPHTKVISMTNFVDFVSSVGTARITAARNIKSIYEKEYEPSKDYWKRLRDHIVEVHERNGSKNDLADLLEEAMPKGKLSNYHDRAQNYRSWWGRKEITWLGTSCKQWVHDSLIVRVNPELGIQINGSPYLVKLYFKGEGLSKAKSEVILHLIDLKFNTPKRRFAPAILDIRQRRLIEPSRAIAGIDVLLEGEALALLRMWNGL